MAKIVETILHLLCICLNRVYMCILLILNATANEAFQKILSHEKKVETAGYIFKNTFTCYTQIQSKTMLIEMGEMQTILNNKKNF